MSYEGSDDDDDVKSVSTKNHNSNFNVVSIFEEWVNYKIKVITKTMLNQTVVQAMKNLQAIYNDNEKKNSSK